MIGPIAWLVLKTGLPRGAVLALLGLAAAAAAILGWKLWLADHDEDVVQQHETAIELRVERQGRAADQNMAARRAADDDAINQERKEFDRATSHLPKSGLSARQRIDACDQLLRQGTDQAILARAGCISAGAAAEARP